MNPFDFQQRLLTPEQALAQSAAKVAANRARAARLGSYRDRLTTAARRHLGAGGCSGDLCRNCSGTGEEPQSWQNEDAGGSCSVCLGRGMR
ncbi:hypothetical protein [Salipiger marinus]|jgi:hypothetical protein|uniref:Uncharacterized protein n=1 Tax=Salipiger marinus TaxID=555512 RepID=A0A1G8MRV6_9RHOB|nr:hypothetical protein [Salipiger marinus]SDI70030.1 hypothetical protein SAMN04487993_1008197 [Salipiger marinus]